MKLLRRKSIRPKPRQNEVELPDWRPLSDVFTDDDHPLGPRD